MRPPCPSRQSKYQLPMNEPGILPPSAAKTAAKGTNHRRRSIRIWSQPSSGLPVGPGLPLVSSPGKRSAVLIETWGSPPFLWNPSVSREAPPYRPPARSTEDCPRRTSSDDPQSRSPGPSQWPGAIDFTGALGDIWEISGRYGIFMAF